MKKTSTRILSIFLALLLCVPMLLSAFATDEAGAKENANEESPVSYEALYVTDVDGDGTSDVTFFYDAYSHTADDGKVSKLTDKNGNALTLPSGSVYTDKGVYMGGKNLSLGNFYQTTDAAVYLELVISQTGARTAGKNSGSMVIGPSKVTLSFRQDTNADGSRAENASPIDESYGVISTSAWATGNHKKFDCDSNPTRLFGAATGQIFTVGIGVEKNFTAKTFETFFVRDASIIHSGTLDYTEESSAVFEFGKYFHVNYHAIRIYEKMPAEAQLRQNHFADLASYFELPISTYLTLSESERALVHATTADISLTDANAKERVSAVIEEVAARVQEAEKKTFYQSLYISDVDGDGTSDITFFYDAYSHTADDGKVSELTDKNSNTLTLPTGSAYTEKGIYMNGKSFSLLDFYDVSGDSYLELVISQTGLRASKTTGTSHIGPTDVLVATKQETNEDGSRKENASPIDESYGVVSKTAWVNDNYKGFDHDGCPLRLFGAATGELFTVGFGAKKGTDTYETFFVRDAAIIHRKAIANTKAKTENMTFGENFHLNYHAIRLYAKMPSEAQLRQNHFADLASYFELDMTLFKSLSEKDRTALYTVCADISLTDPNAREKINEAFNELSYAALYVNHAQAKPSLLWNAFDKKAGTTVSENAFTVSQNAEYGDGYLFNASASLDLTAYLPNFQYGEHVAQKDYTVELVMGARPVNGEDVEKAFRWYFGNFQVPLKFRQKDNAELPLGILAGWASLGDFVSGGSGGFSFNSTSRPAFDVFGNTLNEAYTNTFTFDLTLGETPDKTKDTMQMVFYRDGAKLVHPDNISVPLAYDATEGLKSNRKDDSLIIGGNAALNYYAIRIYEGVLTEAEVRQNHFADLASYFRFDLTVFNALTENAKQALYAQFASTKLTDDKASTKARIESAIDEIYAAEHGVKATDFIDFLGYQVRLTGNAPGLRSLYSVNTDVNTENVLEIGAIMAIKNDRDLALLTPENANVPGSQMAKNTIFAEGIWKAQNIFTRTHEGIETNCFAYTTMYDSDFAATQYECEMLYRAYVTVTLDGRTVTLYPDMTAAIESISLSTVTSAVVKKDSSLKENPLVQRVLESLLADASERLASLETSFNRIVSARLDADETFEDAKLRANELKDALKAISLAGTLAGADTAKLQEQAATLLASAEGIKEQSLITYPSLTDQTAEIESAAAHMSNVIAVIVETLGKGADISARAQTLVAAIDAEKTCQTASYTKAVREKKDVLDALALVETVGTRIASGEFREVKTLKLLTIGNSWSLNATSQLFEIAKDLGYEDIVIGIMYIGGCSLETHYKNAISNATNYDFKKITSGTSRSSEGSTLLDGILDEEWDIITFQQSAAHVALSDKFTSKDGTVNYLEYLINYVNGHKTNAEAKIYYHATWAFANGNTNPNRDEAGYEHMKDQALMDQMIAESMQNDVLSLKDENGNTLIDGIIYSGIAIAEARKHFGAEFQLYTSPDGYHLNDMGCYIVGLVWFGTLTGEDVSSATDVEESFSSAVDHAAAVNAALTGIAAAK